MSRPARVVFIADPLESLNIGHDTTCALMEAASGRGDEVYAATVSDLGALEGKATARCRKLSINPAVLENGHWDVPPDWFTETAVERLVLEDADLVLMRTDPPVNADYLRATYLLDLIDETKTLVVNAPRGLRDANEKLFALLFQDLTPPTLVSADAAEILEVVRDWGTAVLKPTDGMGGRGVMLLVPGDPNLHSLVDSATERGAVQVVVQKYVPACENGDRRIILIGGEPRGVIRRLAQSKDEFRCNMAAGATVEPDTLTPRDLEICARIAPELARCGLVFVGIDVIGDYLTEVNVTSPTGVREIDALTGTHLATEFFEWVDAQTSSRARDV